MQHLRRELGTEGSHRDGRLERTMTMNIRHTPILSVTQEHRSLRHCLLRCKERSLHRCLERKAVAEGMCRRERGKAGLVRGMECRGEHCSGIHLVG